MRAVFKQSSGESIQNRGYDWGETLKYGFSGLTHRDQDLAFRASYLAVIQRQLYCSLKQESPFILTWLAHWTLEQD